MMNMKISTSPASAWEWDNGENLMLFPGNGNGSRKATASFKLKDELKHDAGASFLQVQSASEDGNSSPGGIRTSEASTPEDQQQQSSLVTVAVPAGSGDSGAIGLKLGKRTYFEAVKAIPVTAASPSSCVPIAAKKQRSAMQGTHMVPRCQVEGCKTELTAAKDYHRRHKVCEQHSKSPKVIVNGIEQRFCQQCSRFHILSEFDEGKRSCRRRLAGHNERRRKPQPDSLAINPSRFASAFYGTVEKLRLVDGDIFWCSLSSSLFVLFSAVIRTNSYINVR